MEPAASHSNPLLLFWTSPSLEEAERIATALLEQRLVACATLLPGAKSLYMWEGSLQQSSEVQVILKTLPEHVAQITTQIHSDGSYKNPELLGLPVQWSALEYARWVNETVRMNHGR
jgi:periplasmic divalent cation tolerance protein